MDRTSWIAVIVCTVLMVVYFWYYLPQYQVVPAPEKSAQERQVDVSTPRVSDVSEIDSQGEAQPVMVAVPETPVSQELKITEQLAVLENEWIRVSLTNYGGAIDQVTLKKHTASDEDPVVLNAGSPIPLMNLEGWGLKTRSLYAVTESEENSVTYVLDIQPGLRLERQFKLLDGYQLECVQTIYNTTNSPVVLPAYKLSMGTTTSIYQTDEERRFVGMAWHTPEPGGRYEDKSMQSFYPGFMGFGGGKSELVSDPGDEILWAALKTQFFTLIVNYGERHGTSMKAVKQKMPELRVGGSEIPEGIRADVSMPGFQVNASFRETFNLYVGPKEDSRLRKLGDEKDRLMEFGIFGIISRPLLTVMNWINSYVHNYGISIVLLTVLLRAILWYPQTKANRSMKRMQTVAPVMKEIQEKHKDKPEKMNQEMMKLYQDYGVNPFGGCLPMLIQFPIFLGFYYMLLGSIELRHAEFLWIKDLSQPDTIFNISALKWIPIFEGNINPMPLLMAITMYITMSITPQPQGVDNPMIVVMKIMPVMFLVFCYNFASALSVYWTMQNLLSIVQMKYNMKQEPPTLEALKEEAVKKKKQRKERMQGFGMSARKRK
ncbi:MAG: membrane protein insertase YidC [Verrucomicrobiota bacterium]